MQYYKKKKWFLQTFKYKSSIKFDGFSFYIDLYFKLCYNNITSCRWIYLFVNPKV
jgi:hypothetical protein